MIKFELYILEKLLEKLSTKTEINFQNLYILIEDTYSFFSITHRENEISIFIDKLENNKIIIHIEDSAFPVFHINKKRIIQIIRKYKLNNIFND